MNTRVLLVEDDEEDYILTRKLLRGEPGITFDLKWARSFDAALEELRGPYDVCLVDYRLGPNSGLLLIAAAIADGFLGPMILLTGQGDYGVDVQAMKAGAADYLVKHQCTPDLMERVIRHSIERKSSELALKRSEEALRRSEAHLRAVIEKSAEAISLTTADGATEYVTPVAAARLLGFEPAEMAGQTPRDHAVPEDRERVATELARLMESGDRDTNLEFRVQHRDGSIRWIESSGTNLLADPDVRAIVGNYRDVTARKHAEAALHESRDQLEEAQAISHVGSWTSGVGPGDAVTWSRECYRIFGLAEGTPITVESYLSYVHPADREMVSSARRDAMEDVVPYDVQHRVLRPDGRVCWVRARGVVARNPAVGATGVLGTLQDITDRHVAVEALKASEERYRRIVENTSEGVWMYDREDNTTFMNARMAEMLGCTVGEAVGQSVYMFVSDAQRAEAERRTERRRKGIPERVYTELKRKDGTTVYVSVQANPLLDADGHFEAALALVADISAQHRADEDRSRLAAIVESSEDAIMSTKLDGEITSWNIGAENLYQYSAAEMAGKSALLLVPAGRLEDERRIFARVARGESIRQYESERTRKDGSTVEVALTVCPVRDANGIVVGISKITRDLTQRRLTEAALHRTEEQFRQAQKMEAVGRLAGGVAHDFNNLLSVILSYAGLALEELAPNDPLLVDFTEIQKAGRRGAELTRQLLAFSRQQVLQPRVIDLNESVAGMKTMLGRLLGEDVEVTIVLDSQLGRVLADPGQVEQVVMNLAVNARDAMPGGGKVTIETRNVELGAGHVSVGAVDVVAGRYVMLALSDSGTGMDESTRARIFEPFFTTKELGKGTGLGLATVFGIVKQSSGYVSVYSEPGGGSAFKIYLPRTDRPPEVPTTLESPLILTGSETILLVEDDEQVRAVAGAILRRHGYRVLETSNGPEAATLAAEFTSTIHLLLTDVVMPLMSGRKLVEHLAPLRPDMKVLFASGYTDDAIVRHGVLDSGVAFLQKPFTPDALLRKVRATLESRPHTTDG